VDESVANVRFMGGKDIFKIDIKNNFSLNLIVILDAKRKSK